MSNRLLLLFIFTLTLSSIVEGQKLPDSLNHFLSLHLAKIPVQDTAEIRSWLVTGLNDVYKGVIYLDTLNCTDYPVYIPDGGLLFDEMELTAFLTKKKSPQDYTEFIRDHDADYALFRVFYNQIGKVVKIERLSIEYNEEFGSVQSTQLFSDGRLKLMWNQYCATVKNILVIREFEWSDDLKNIERIKTFLYR